MVRCTRCDNGVENLMYLKRGLCGRCVNLEAEAIYFKNEPEQKSGKLEQSGKCELCGGGPPFESGPNKGFCGDCVEKVFEQSAKAKVKKMPDRPQLDVEIPRDEGPGPRCDCRHLQSNHATAGCAIYLEDASGWCPCARKPVSFLTPASWEKMTFGRYDGWSVGDLPKSYLLWAARLADSSELATASPALRAALVAEAWRRGLDLKKADITTNGEAVIREG